MRPAVVLIGLAVLFAAGCEKKAKTQTTATSGGGPGQPRVRSGGEDAYLLDARCVVAESLPDAVAERLLVLVLVHRDRQVTRDRGLRRDRLIGGQIVHLARDARIGRTQQADIRDALDQHQQAVKAHAQGQPAMTGEAGGGEHPRMGEPALPDLHPAAVVPDIDLAAVLGVRVRPRLEAVRQAGDERPRAGTRSSRPGPRRSCART